MRCNSPAAVDEGTHRGRQLHRRHLERLAEGNRRQLHEPHVFLFMHDRSGLSRKVNARLFQEAKLLKIPVIGIDAQP